VVAADATLARPKIPVRSELIAVAGSVGTIFFMMTFMGL
jgi:hypothetical protein